MITVLHDLSSGFSLPDYGRSSTSAPDLKWCARCGREIEWRKSGRDWHSLKWCSTACRQRGLTDLDRSLEAMIIHLLQQRSRIATICPSEAAAQFDPSSGVTSWTTLAALPDALLPRAQSTSCRRESLLTLQLRKARSGSAFADTDVND